MSAGGTAFVRRALLFLDAARAGRHPNARWLAEEEEISIPTARRVVNRLRDDFGAPLSYSDADRGWELTHGDWSFPAAGLVDRRELLALALAIDVGRIVSDPELEDALETFWKRLADRLDTSRIEMDALLAAFSSDRTDRSVVADPLVLDVIEAVARRRVVRFRYASPWNDSPSGVREAEPLHVRCMDGVAYLLARTAEGQRVFHLSHVASLEVTERTFEADEGAGDHDWAATFGVWTGPEVLDICLRIGPPGAQYFGGQQWHPAQQDSWDGDVLVRRFAAHASPELVRRLLGLGEFLLSVEPQSARDAVTQAAEQLLRHLDPTRLAE